MGLGAVMALQGTGAITSAYGSYTQGLAQASYFKYLAANSRTEADLVTKQGEQERTLAQNQGLQETKTLNRQVSETEGAQAAAAGANVGGGSVTTADIAGDTFDKAKLDSLAIKYNADVKSWSATEGARLKSWQLNREAGEYEVARGAAKEGGKLGAVNSLLSGAGQVAGTWYQGQLYSKGGRTAGLKTPPSPKSGTRVPVNPGSY